jgi:hypothetical protein
VIEESGGAFASLSSTPGMGNVVPPTPNEKGSGDQFPTLTAGTPAAKGKKKKSKTALPAPAAKTPNPIDTSLMSFDTFLKNMKKNQNN